MCERQTSEYLNDDNADGNANQYSNVTTEPRLKGSLTSLHSQYTVYNNYTTLGNVGIHDLGKGIWKTKNQFGFSFINQIVQKFDILADGFPTETACNPQFKLKVTKKSFNVETSYFYTTARILKSHDITTANRPHRTLRNFVVHPKDKVKDEEKTELIYCVPCKNCFSSYIGETGRKFGLRIKEHKKEVDSFTAGTQTRASRARESSVTHKSAITDHAVEENHVIDWDKAKVVEERHSDRPDG